MVGATTGDRGVSRRTLLKGAAAATGAIGTGFVVPSLVGPGARAVPPTGRRRRS
jgi:hypothetical protein